MISGLLVYLIGTVFICYLTFRLRENLITPLVWSALFWIIILFSVMNAVGKSFIAESKGRLIYYYSVASPQAIIISKIAYNFILCSLLSLSGYLLFYFLLGNPIRDVPLFLLVILLASLGFSASLTLLSGIASRANNSHILMAVLGFPVIISILLTIIKVTRNCLDGLDRSASWDEILILISINFIVTSVSYLLFPYIWRS